MKQGSTQDFNLLSPINTVLEQLNAAPAGTKGRYYMNTITNTLHYYNGTTVYDTGFNAHSLSEMLAPTTNLSFGNFKGTNVALGVNPTDIATMANLTAVLDASIAGLALKYPVRANITSNVTIATPPASFDGVTFVTNDRILLSGQTTQSQNGPYLYNAGGLVRVGDAAQNFELQEGAIWFIAEGTIGTAQQWRLTNIGTITPGTTAITPVIYSSGTSYTAGTGLVLTAGQFSAQRTVGNASYIPFKSTGLIGNGSLLSITVTDNFPIDKTAVIRDAVSNAEVGCDKIYAANQTTFVFTGTAPTTNQYAYVIYG